MASPEEPLAPRPQAPLPAAGDQPRSGHGKLRPEPRRSAAGGGSAAGPGPAPERPGRGRAERAAPSRPPPSCAGRASPAGGPGAQTARGGSSGGGGWVPARALFALAFSSSVPSPSPSSFYFWSPPPLPPPSLVPSSSAFHLPVRLPGRQGAAAAAGGGGGDGGSSGGGQEAAPLSVSPSTSPRGGGGSAGGRRRLFLSPALLGWLLPARAGPRPPPPPRLPLCPAARRAGFSGSLGAGADAPGPCLGPSAGGGRTSQRPGGAGFALAAAARLLFGSDMEDGPSNNTSCFRRLTECFLSPSKCLLHIPCGWGGQGV